MLKELNFKPDGPDGSFLHVNGTNSVSTLFWRSRFTESKLTPSVIAMAAALNEYGTTMLQQAEVLNEKGYRTKAEAEAIKIAAPWRDLRKAIMDEKASLNDRRSTMLKVEGGNAELRSEYRIWLSAMNASNAYTTIVKSENVNLVASAIEGGPELIGLDETIFERIEERFAVVKYMFGSGIAFQPAPLSIDNLTGISPDWTALEEHALQQWQSIVNGTEEIEAAEQYLAGVLTFIAATVAGMTPQEAFNIVKPA